MARTKRFQELIDRLPETGKTLLDWHKWLTRNHFKRTPIEVIKGTNDLQITYIYDYKHKERYKDYRIYIIIKSNVSGYYLRNKLNYYLSHRKEYETAPIIFKEYDEGIEEKNINLFQIRIRNMYNKDEDMTVY